MNDTIKIKVKYPWGDRFLNYKKIRIVEKNETTGEIYYDVEISKERFEALGNCYKSLQEMAEQYLRYQCFNEQKAYENNKGFYSFSPYCFSYDIIMNRPNKNGVLEPRTERVTRYTFRELDYTNPISDIE